MWLSVLWFSNTTGNCYAFGNKGQAVVTLWSSQAVLCEGCWFVLARRSLESEWSLCYPECLFVSQSLQRLCAENPFTAVCFWANFIFNFYVPCKGKLRSDRDSTRSFLRETYILFWKWVIFIIIRTSIPGGWRKRMIVYCVWMCVCVCVCVLVCVCVCLCFAKHFS